jgi:diguanylate cyclase (GGDEF)-like protein
LYTSEGDGAARRPRRNRRSAARGETPTMTDAERTRERDRFFLREFLAPIMPVGMLLTAVFVMALWVVDRIAGEPLDAKLTAVTLLGGLILLGLAGAARVFTHRAWLHASATASILYGGVFASVLSLRAQIDAEGLLTVIPACLLMLIIGTIFSLRFVHLTLGYLAIMTPPTLLAATIDPAVSNEGRYLPFVIAFSLLCVVPLYFLTRLLKWRYHAALAQHHERSQRDPLTGLLNRLAWRERALHILTGDGDVALLYADVDHFKRINDLRGHATGDEVLRRTADLLGRAFPADALISRFGGEEFVVLMHDCDLDRARRDAEEFRESISAEAFPELAVTISIGVACHLPGQTLDDLLHRADLALLRAKANGRNRIEIEDAPAREETPAAQPTMVAVERRQAGEAAGTRMRRAVSR